MSAIQELTNAIEEQTIGAARPHVAVVSVEFFKQLCEESKLPLNQSTLVAGSPVDECWSFMGIPLAIVELVFDDAKYLVTKPHQRDLIGV